jgi:hypothetical protein
MTFKSGFGVVETPLKMRAAPVAVLSIRTMPTVRAPWLMNWPVDGASHETATEFGVGLAGGSDTAATVGAWLSGGSAGAAYVQPAAVTATATPVRIRPVSAARPVR